MTGNRLYIPSLTNRQSGFHGVYGGLRSFNEVLAFMFELMKDIIPK
jgi:hypothetical protein